MKALSSKRWYDRHPTISKSVSLMETFPPEVQTIIADGIMRLAARECEAKELMANLRSLGPDKVLGIFKSKNKRRATDRNTTVHQAMNHLFILTEENRLFIANQVIEIVNYIYSYLQSCKTYRENSSIEEIAELTSTYIEAGGDHTRALLESIEDRFNKNITSGILRGEGKKLLEDDAGLMVRDESARNS